MKYKVGDKVRIKSLDWYNENKNHCGEIPLFKPSGLFVPDMSRYCNNIMTIKDICYGICYRMKEDFWHYNWTDEMIEGLVEEEILIEKVDDNGLPFNEWLSHKGAFYIPDGYELKDENGNVINATKIVLEKKKKEYPKTYWECKYILEITTPMVRPDYNGDLIVALQRLLICRDAYWKIAGEEMGLGKPWENSRCEVVYGICRDEGNIVKRDDYWGDTQIFEFPIREMRDAFYENFKEEIEECKELL